MKRLTLTPSDRANLTNVPLGLAALAEVRRELRRRVADRNDAWLIACAAECCIALNDEGRRVEAVCFTRHSQVAEDGARLDWHRNEALCTDRTIRSALRRLLDVYPNNVVHCAAAPVEWHKSIAHDYPST